MPLKTIATGRGLMGGGTYADKVLAYGPIAYWPLWESSGTVAHCLVSAAQNGTYNSDVSTWPVGAGIGDGNTAPQADGVNDYVSVHSASLQTAFNGALGSMACWALVPNAGVWADGIIRVTCQMRADGNNYINIRKAAAAGTLDWIYRAGGAFSIRSLGGLAFTTFMHLAITWNAAGNRMRAYLNGAQVGADVAIGGVWAGALAANATLICASFNTPLEPWSGGDGHVAVWTRELTAPEVLSLATTVP